MNTWEVCTKVNLKKLCKIIILNIHSLSLLFIIISLFIIYSETEQTLRREILEVTERLEILTLFTKREKFSSKQLKDKNTFKLDVQEAKLAKLE